MDVNFSESDKMLTILTPDLGKISCVAKGARRIKSRMLASSQLFAFSNFILYKSNGDTYYINSSELIESFYNIRNDLDSLNCAMECTKFLKDNIQENQNSIFILKLLLNTIYLLSTSNKNTDIIRNVFLIKAICILGYTPLFFSCGGCGGKETLNYFDFKESSLKCEKCSESKEVKLSDSAVIAIRYIIKSDLKKLFSFKISEEVLNEIELFRKLYIENKINKN
jgi:DNA repair protein RecO (recombination protein O)